MSLDGFFAGPNGEYGRIVMDPETDFREDTDTFLIGPQGYTMRCTGKEATPSLLGAFRTSFVRAR